MGVPPVGDRHDEPSNASNGIAARPRPRWVARLRRHLVLVIAAKLALIALLYALFFSPAQRPDIDAGGVADRLYVPR